MLLHTFFSQKKLQTTQQQMNKPQKQQKNPPKTNWMFINMEFFHCVKICPEIQPHVYNSFWLSYVVYAVYLF